MIDSSRDLMNTLYLRLVASAFTGLNQCWIVGKVAEVIDRAFRAKLPNINESR